MILFGICDEIKWIEIATISNESMTFALASSTFVITLYTGLLTIDVNLKFRPGPSQCEMKRQARNVKSCRPPLVRERRLILAIMYMSSG
jgi:hypothetical protein